MHDLTAQVTSSLLPFSGVTVDALGEDEITLDSVLHGRFTVGRSGLAWLACGPHLEVVHAVTGERLSAYCFSGGGEHPPTILAARDFSWLKRSGLLVGLEETEGSVLCLYDLGLSRVAKAVVIPGRITAIEPLVSYGGASTSTQHLHQSLRWFFGIAAVVTDLGHVLLVDLCLDDLSCSQSELDASDLQVVTKSPAEIPRLREVSTREGRHLCLQLNGPSGVGATALQYVSRTNQLAVGFSDGFLQLWNMKTLKKEYHSQLEGGRLPVHSFTFQEPENDPRNCCYLWAVQSSQELEGDMVSLRLLQLAFSERKCLASGKILYEGLEYCEERYSQDLSGAAFPLRAQTTNTRLLNCQTIEKFRPHPDRDDGMNEVASPDTSVSIFIWQIKVYGQGTPSTYIGVFDINRWYHAQMPDSFRMGESLKTCPYLAVWSLDPVVQMVSPHVFLDVLVHERSLCRGLPYTSPPPEQYFNPTTYNFDATCLLNSGIVHLTCSGYQKETLAFLKKAAPCSSDIISTSYSHCLMSGLLSSRLSDSQTSSTSQEDQLDAILSTAVETSSLGLITGCIKQWTAEEQPGSALNLRYILDWAWNKVVQTKEELDGICAPLFDSSSNFTDHQTMQLLEHSQRLLGNLSAIFHCLLSEAQELTQKGLVGLMNKNMVSSLISKYAQVVLWFCRTGLLPEGSDDNAVQISRPFYTHSVISNYYTIRREELTRLAKGKWCADCLMIDGLVGQCGERLTNLWKRDEGGTGQYPPPTLHALLDIYLLDNIDEATKHAVVIYLLLDVMYSFPNKDGASVESFPTAFAIPVGLVKLVQGLWLLDHHDHQSSFELLLHPAASQCHFEWQHERVLQALMCQGQQSVALRYFHVTKPLISTTSQAKLCLSVLLHNRCLIEAWCLLRQHSTHLNMAELLGFMYESCQELGLIKELLKLPLSLNEQESLEKFLQGTGGLQNRELLMVHYLQQANYIPALQLNQSLKMNLVNERDPKLKERFNTRNSILDQYGKVLPRVQRKLAMERAKPYQHPNTIHREISRPQPLSTITKRSASEKVMSRAGFISNVLIKIEEVLLGKGTTPQSSPTKSPKLADVQSSSPKPSSLALPEPFLGTPITMTAKRKSRLLDLVVHPSCQTPRPLFSPPRPPPSWVSPKSVSKAPELTLLQTPQVVKRARALATSDPGFSAFTPQSILRSSLRPTPVATPSASPGRSITPPLRTKESHITFIEKEESPELEKSIRWTNGMAAESEISRLSRGSTLSKATHKTWPSCPGEEDEDEEVEEQTHVKFLPPEGSIASPQLKGSESKSSSIHGVVAETEPSDATQACLSLSFNASQTSVQSADTTLEYYDAPMTVAEEDDDDVVTVHIRAVEENEEPMEKPVSISEETPLVTSENAKKEDDVREDKASEDETEVCLQHGNKKEELQQTEKDGEQDIEPSSNHNAPAVDQEEISSHQKVEDLMTESAATELESQNLAGESEIQDIQSKSPEGNQHPEPPTATETTNEASDDVEQSADLTGFVQRHLFDDDLSSPLTRSAIHNASQSQNSLNSDSLGEDEVEEEAVPEAPPAFTTQKSAASVTSSEPTGTDSHSVVSVNDSEELSNSSSGEEEAEEEEEEDSTDQAEEVEEEEEEQEQSSDLAEGEEEEDSGSEVEIIEEVQGNGQLLPPQPSSVFVQEDDANFLSAQSEEEAAVFSIVAPDDANMKFVEEDDMEGEVVMVRVGADDEEMGSDNDDEGSSYMELKPTTLLLPMEFVDGQQLGLPDLQQSGVAEDTHGNFSLMLEMDEDSNKDPGTLSVESKVQSLDSATQSQDADICSEFLVQPEVTVLGSDDQDTAESEEATQEEKREEMENVDGNIVDVPNDLDLVQLQTDPQTEDIGEKEEMECAKEEMGAALGEDSESAVLPVSRSTPVEENAIAVGVKTSVAKTEASVEVIGEDCKKAPVEEQKQPEENGPVNADREMSHCIEAEQAVEHEQQPTSTEEENYNHEKVKVGMETKKRGKERPRKDKNIEDNSARQVLSSNSESDEPIPEIPSSHRKKAPSTPTRMMTRGRTVSFISPLSEETEKLEEGVKGNVEDVETSTVVTATPHHTPRKGKQGKGMKAQAMTPRRSARIAHLDPPKEIEKMAVLDSTSSLISPSKALSPVRRSQRAIPTRSSQRIRSGTTEVSATMNANNKDENIQEVKVSDKKVSQTPSIGSRTPTPSQRKTTMVTTSRRSSRNNVKEVPTSLETVKEEEEHDGAVSPPMKPNTKKTKAEPAEVLPALLEEEEVKEVMKQQLINPRRPAQQFTRISINPYPQVKLVPMSLPHRARKLTGGTTRGSVTESEDLHKSEQTKNPRQSPRYRSARSKLWDHPEEDLPLLDTPLEVDSNTPVADALIRRLKDEQEKQGGGLTAAKSSRTSRSAKKSSPEPAVALPPKSNSLVAETADDESSPGEHSFIYSPPRRRIRAHKAESTGPSEQSSAPVTRSRVKTISQDKTASGDSKKEAAISKTSKANRRTARAKAVSPPAPIAEVELISPLPSPAEPLTRALKRIKDEASATGRTLRRKRVLDMVFTKPVTRRKKL
ncbi:uncharacterized protein ahctf1 [Pholidichthys leucotaenia]